MARQIVVVDDEQVLLDVVSDLLEMEGFSVVRVSRPQEVEHLQPHIDPCLFLIDIMLPGMSGVDLAKTLRDDGFPSTPMIAMSSSTDLVQRAERTRLFEETMAKPFDPDTLLSAVERHAGST